MTDSPATSRSSDADNSSGSHDVAATAVSSSRLSESEVSVPVGETALPRPESSVEQHDIVIYDGQCGMCRAQIGRLARCDWGKRLRFLSLHDKQVVQMWPDLPAERLLDEMVVIDRHGGRHWGAEAVRYLARRVPLLWPWVPLLHIPGSMFVWRPLYRWIARNRYRFAGRVVCDGDSCQRHF